MVLPRYDKTVNKRWCIAFDCVLVDCGQRERKLTLFLLRSTFIVVRCLYIVSIARKCECGIPFYFYNVFKSIHIFLWWSRFCAWCIQNSCMLIPYARLLFKLRSSSYINWCNSLLIKCYTQPTRAKIKLYLCSFFAVCICCCGGFYRLLGFGALFFSFSFVSSSFYVKGNNNSNIIRINIPYI